MFKTNISVLSIGKQLLRKRHILVSTALFFFLALIVLGTIIIGGNFQILPTVKPIQAQSNQTFNIDECDNPTADIVVCLASADVPLIYVELPYNQLLRYYNTNIPNSVSSANLFGIDSQSELGAWYDLVMTGVNSPTDASSEEFSAIFGSDAFDLDIGGIGINLIGALASTEHTYLKIWVADSYDTSALETILDDTNRWATDSNNPGYRTTTIEALSEFPNGSGRLVPCPGFHVQANTAICPYTQDSFNAGTQLRRPLPVTQSENDLRLLFELEYTYAQNPLDYGAAPVMPNYTNNSFTRGMIQALGAPIDNLKGEYGYIGFYGASSALLGGLFPSSFFYNPDAQALLASLDLGDSAAGWDRSILYNSAFSNYLTSNRCDYHNPSPIVLFKNENCAVPNTYADDFARWSYGSFRDFWIDTTERPGFFRTLDENNPINYDEPFRIFPLKYNNVISSIQVEPGTSVRLYEGIDQNSPSYCLTSTASDLTNYFYEGTATSLNNTISGLQWFRDTTCGMSNEAPYIDIIEPNGIGDIVNNNFITSFDITWEAFDSDNIASIELKYDNNTLSDDGFLGDIATGGLTENDGFGSFTWDTTSLPNGLYYVYATISDGLNEPYSVYSDGPILIGNEPPTAATNPSPPDNGVDNSSPVTLSWDRSSDPDGDQITYFVYAGPRPYRLNLIDTVEDNPAITRPSLDYTPTGDTIYWTVVATDGDISTLGEIWNFTTQPILPAINPYPADGEIFSDTNIWELQWDNPNDLDLYYTVYMKSSNEQTPAFREMGDQFVAANSRVTFDLYTYMFEIINEFQPGTTHTWKVVPFDADPDDPNIAEWTFSFESIGTDIAFVIDESATMGPEISLIRAQVDTIINAANQCTGDTRFALTSYRNSIDNRLNFTSDTNRLKNELNSLRSVGGLVRVYSALNESMDDSLGWRENTSNQKYIFLIGDAPPSEDRSDPLSLADITQTSIDQNIRVFTYFTNSSASGLNEFVDIANSTSGGSQHITNLSTLVDTIANAIGICNDPANLPATFSTVPDQTVEINNTLNLDLSTYVTNPDGDTLTYSIISGPTDSNFNFDTITGVITWSDISSDNIGNYTVEVSVSDGIFTDITSFIIDVVEPPVAPNIIDIADQYALSGDTFSLDVDASDQNTNDTLTFSISGAPSGMSINSTTGVITWNIPSAFTGTNTITVTVTDSTGLTDSTTFTLTVNQPIVPQQPVPPSDTGYVFNICGTTPTAYNTANGNQYCGFVGNCFSTNGGTDGYCQTFSGSRIDVYGCTNKRFSSSYNYSCDGGNGGDLLTYGLTGTVSLSSYFNNPAYDDYCTFQVDIFSSGGVIAENFIVWERNDCGSTPPPPPTTFTSCEAVTTIPYNECKALEAFYNSTGGDNWTRNGDKLNSTGTNGWLTNLDPCQWYGVWCEAGHVSRIYLNNNNMVGTIPGELGNLSNLNILRMSYNDLLDLPAEIGNLTSLVDLQMQGNNLTGPIPSTIGNLSSLEVLSLGNNNFTGTIPREIGNLNSIEYINVVASSLTGSIPPEIGNLSSLESLTFQSNDLTGAIPPEIGNLSSLTFLSLASNDLIGSIPAEMGNLTLLTNLLLSTNNLSGPIPKELGNLSSLTELNLSRNNISGNIPNEIGNLSSIMNLYLAENSLTGPIPSEIGNLIQIKNLFLHDNQLSGTVPSSIGNLTLATWIHLEKNLSLTGPLPSEMVNLSELRFFDLIDTTICEPQDQPMQNWLNSLSRYSQSGIDCPSVDFDIDTASGDLPLTVNFTDTSALTGITPTSWQWDFDNDGIIDSTDQNPSYTYNSAGTFTVTLTVSDGTISDTNVKTDLITVNNDADGIEATIDLSPATFSNEFSDVSLGGTTFGSVVTRGDQVLIIEDIISGGIRIQAGLSGGVSPAIVQVCSNAGTFTLNPGDEIIIVCSSVIVEAITGAVDSTFTGTNGIQVATELPVGQKVTFDEINVSLFSEPTNTQNIGVYILGEQRTITPGQTGYFGINASFGADVLSGTIPLIVNFTDYSASISSTITSWSWDFDNDGVPDSTDQNPSYMYNTIGDYTVSLTVSDGTLTDTITRTNFITVLDVSDISADFTSVTTSGDSPLTVSFVDNSTSTNTTITSWSWDFDNDGVPDSTDQNPSVTYNTPGIYSVSLTVSDGTISETITKTDLITVTQPASISAEFSSDVTSGDAPLTVSFIDNSTVVSTTITNWEWDFDNDGIPDSTDQNPSYTYNTAGSYSVTLTVSDGTLSDSITKTDLITVNEPVSLNAEFSSDITSGDTPLTVSFTDNSTATNTTINSWEWDFDNDGTPDSTDQNPSVTFNTPGTYTVSLTTSDGTISDTITKTDLITVTDGSNPGITTTILEDFETTPLVDWTTTSGGSSTISAQLSTPGYEGNNSYEVIYQINDWGLAGKYFSLPIRDWSNYENFDFWMEGTNSGNTINVSLLDNEPDGNTQTNNARERFEYQVVDNFTGWQKITIPFNDFTRRTDWQPPGAPNDGLTLTDIYGYEFYMSGTGVLDIDSISLSTTGTITNQSPTISIVEPDGNGDTASNQFVITWSDSDPDDNASIALYYDTDNSGTDGVGIVSGLSEDSTVDSYTWDTSSIPDGSYYVYAVIDDGTNPAITSYSNGAVTVDNSTPPPTTLLFNDFENGAMSELFSENDGSGSWLAYWTTGPGQVGNSSLQVQYGIQPYGWALVSKYMLPTQTDWSSYNSFSFWMEGTNSGNEIRLGVLDNPGTGSGDTRERFEYMITDNFTGWQYFEIPFSSFTRRADWQPAGAPNDGFTLTDVSAFEFQLTSGNGMFKLDHIELK